MSPRRSGGNLASLARGIGLVVFDFDGVFTDNTVLAFDDGTEAVSCWRGDGLGIRAVQAMGIEAFVLSTETNGVVGVRCRKLKLPFLQGCENKGAALTSLTGERGLELRQVAYVGNDINDLECLRMVGLPIVVADAHPSVRRAALWRTRLPGGRGAVREVCDFLCDQVGSRSKVKSRRGS